jgi:hypothetical protein
MHILKSGGKGIGLVNKMVEPASEANLEDERKLVDRLRLGAESQDTEAKPEDFVIIDGKYRVVSERSPLPPSPPLLPGTHPFLLLAPGPPLPLRLHMQRQEPPAQSKTGRHLRNSELIISAPLAAL